ncbi:MAG: restriction endonuclease [Deltaproteobacteria bacterium]|nr:restriction endonuclease [Deltaproteobacteria bacterium]
MSKSGVPDDAVFSVQRRELHAALISAKVLTRDSKGIVSIADGSSALSRDLADGVYTQITKEIAATARPVGQQAGAKLEELIRVYLEQTFGRLDRLRPGKWQVLGGKAIANFEQYQHLLHLQKAIEHDVDLAASLGNDYVVKPDVLVVRSPEEDDFINTPTILVDHEVARNSAMRLLNNDKDILHASVSTKWTLRSDRAQNARTEALNLLRNRKGRAPHVVVVTGEPMPSRIASLALGTGDIDCVYHLFLHELEESVGLIADAGRAEDAKEMLSIMIKGRRLKDISDLPLDLAV